MDVAASEPSKGRTFSLDITSPGAASLRETVKDKLAEFMGSYTDDVLAEYVVVLVGHGKHQAQATKDLDAFLGNQSEAFVSWLWEHLSSNIQLYTIAPKPSRPPNNNDHIVKNREVPVKESHTDSQLAKSNAQVSSVTIEEERPARSRKESVKEVDTRARKDLDVGVPTFGRDKTKSRIANSGNDRRHGSSTRSFKRPRSPDISVEKERSHADERDHRKRHASPPRVNASRRLLESAVRDAVAPAGCHSKRTESSLKRLRSVVSADAERPAAVEEGNVEPPKVKACTNAGKQTKRSMPAMLVAMKAAAAAAEDVNKVRGRHMGSVWDRLGEKSDRVDDIEEAAESVRNSDNAREEIESTFRETDRHDNDDASIQKRSRLRSVSDGLSKVSTEDFVAVLSDPVQDGFSEIQPAAVKGRKWQPEGIEDINFQRSTAHKDGHRVRSKDMLEQSHEESVTVQYRLAQSMEENAKKNCNQKASSSSTGLTNSSQKILNISVNVNTWKPPHYDTLNTSIEKEKAAATLSSKRLQDQTDKIADFELVRSDEAKELDLEDDIDQNVLDMRKRMRQVQLEMTKLRAKQTEVTKDVQQTCLPPVSVAKLTQQTTQDNADMRTVFVTNIHFAATKELVATHFSRCGEVARVIMVTDAATGQFKGSAYVEFCSRDVIEKALALNESSFLSRLLKVVRKDAAIPDSSPVPIRPPLLQRPTPFSFRVPLRSRFLRGSPYLMRRISNIPRPYANAPNLQWKRDSAVTGGTTSSVNSNGTRPAYGPLRLTRSFSYIRSARNTPQAAGAVLDQNDASGQEQKDDSSKEQQSCNQQEDGDGQEEKWN